MIQGFCVGGAFMQLLGCDFAIAAEDATFSLSEVNWGILPGALVSKVVADTVLRAMHSTTPASASRSTARRQRASA